MILAIHQLKEIDRKSKNYLLYHQFKELNHSKDRSKNQFMVMNSHLKCLLHQLKDNSLLIINLILIKEKIS